MPKSKDMAKINTHIHMRLCPKGRTQEPMERPPYGQNRKNLTNKIRQYYDIIQSTYETNIHNLYHYKYGANTSSLIIREMQIKSTMIYHFISVRMAIVIKSINKLLMEGVEEREPSYTVGGNVNLFSHYGEQYGGSSKTKSSFAI